MEAFEVMPSCEFCTTLLCARAWMHVIFSFSSLQILCSVFQGVHHGGITSPLLHMKQFDSVSGFHILTFAYRYPAGGIHARRTCALSCTVLASRSRFHLACLP